MNSTFEIIFGLLGGLALFLFGMNMMSDCLQKAAGDKMRKILALLTKNPVLGVLAGALTTAVLQSSSATTVMAIGFVSAGLMKLPQGISIILGANIGTTMTAQLLAFKISDYIFVIIFIGFIISFITKSEKVKAVGETIFAFGLLFLGIETMGDVMEPLASSPVFTDMISRVADVPVLGAAVGTLMTLVVQSSSATIAVLQNFASQAGLDGVTSIIGLSGAIPILLGDNIGTTITGQLIALDIGAIAPLFAIAGVGAIMFIKSEKVHHISSIFAGLGILFMGMDMMGAAMSPLKESEAFISLMTKFDNPLLGILVGALFTAVIQSSSASVGILQALASTGMIPLSSAVFVLFGQNIGTCITAVLASIGMKVNAKRTTVIHLLFNIIGTVLFTVICLVTPYVTWIEAMTPGDPVAQIANAHTVFNIVTTLLLLPFGTHMANIAVRILPDSKKADDEDLRLKYIRPFESSYAIGHSAVAVSQVRDEVNRMRDMVAKNISDSFDSLVQYDEKLRKKVSEREEYIDFLNKGISEYIVSLMASEMNMSDSRKINGYYAIISNLERIGDHAVNLAEYGDDMRKWEIDFSDTVKEELNEMKAQCIAALDNLKEVTSENVERILSQAVIIEQKTDDMRDKYFKKQMQRLKKGKCKPQSGIVFSEILTDFERMGDHALNIAQQYREME